MGVAAVVFVLVTVLVGTVVLADLGAGAGGGRLIGGHVALALAGALVLCAGAFAGSVPIEWGSLALLVAAVAAGVALYRRTRPAAGVSTGVLIAHGAGAGLTVVFLLLAVLRV
jgi:hypothetical protein